MSIIYHLVFIFKILMRNGTDAFKLPEIFYNARNGSEIRLSINPDTKNVNVAYRVFSQNCNDFILVDSESKILDNGM